MLLKRSKAEQASESGLGHGLAANSDFNPDRSQKEIHHRVPMAVFGPRGLPIGEFHTGTGVVALWWRSSLPPSAPRDKRRLADLGGDGARPSNRDWRSAT